jgi:hypothetical protein
MKLSAQMTYWMSLLFATLSVAYAISGYLSTQEMPAGAERDDAFGYVWFWLFLGGVGLCMAFVSWLMVKGRIAYPNE